jgi:hypothetical protein
MKVRVGNIEAACACGSREFEAPPHLPPYRPGEAFVCAGCGQETRYGELLDLIGEEAIRRAHRAIESLKHEVRSRSRR